MGNVDAVADIEAGEIDLNIGDSVHISSVTLPQGTVPTITDRDFTVATIAGAAAMIPDPEETAAAAAAAEGAAPAEGAAAEGEAKTAEAKPTEAKPAEKGKKA